MTYSKRELGLIWLDSFSIDYKYKRALYEVMAKGDIEIKSLIEKNLKVLENAVGTEICSVMASSANKAYLEYLVYSLASRGITAVTLFSENYPSELADTSCAPIVLYAKGNLDLLQDEKFAIVGSRKTIPLAESIAERYTESLIGGGLTLVTGIAEGVDSAVLKTALKIGGGKIISVIAGGFDNIYPKSNIHLLENVIKNGLVLTEYSPETITQPYHFPVRNRIIAGLAKGVLVVSGGMKSGTMYTAGYAMEYGRDLFAVPYSIGVSVGEGCNELIKRTASLTDSPKDILDFYGLTNASTDFVTELSDQERDILNAIKGGAAHIEKIGATLNKKTYELSPTLAMLEIKGLVVKTVGNEYSLTGKT